MKTRVPTVRRAGLTWAKQIGDWYAQVGRFELKTWQFGSVHQAWIRAEVGGAVVQIDLLGRPSRDLAMEAMATWARGYEARGPQGAEAAVAEEYARYPSLRRTRLDALRRIVLSGAWSWFDGALLDTSPEGHIEFARSAGRQVKEAETQFADSPGTIARIRAVHAVPETLGPVPDSGAPVHFYDFAERALLVPDGVRADWLFLVYEAVCALRDRSRGEGSTRHHALAVSACADLRRRFPVLGAMVRS